MTGPTAAEITPDRGQPDGAPDHSHDANNPLRRIFDEASDGVASSEAIPRSNSETMVRADVEEIIRLQSLAGGHGLISVTIHMDMGDRLLKIKKVAPRGTFDPLVETELGFKR